MQHTPLASLILAALLVLGQRAAAAPEVALGNSPREAEKANHSISIRENRRNGAPLHFVHRTPNFEVLHNEEDYWGAHAGETLERVRCEFYRSFRAAGFALVEPQERLTWMCFSNRAEFDRYAREADRMSISALEEYYSARTNRVALMRPLRAPAMRAASGEMTPIQIDPAIAALPPESNSADALRRTSLDLTRASHEAAHQLSFNSGLLKRGVMYPFWVVEGLATNFEADASGAMGLGRRNDMRCRHLLRAYAGDRLISLDNFVSVTRISLNERRQANEVYAQAWALFQFLLEEYPEGMKHYLATLAQLDPGRRSEHTLRAEFIASFGPISSIESSWERYIRSRTVPLRPQTASLEGE